jgi:hypothetical protein
MEDFNAKGKGIAQTLQVIINHVTPTTSVSSVEKLDTLLETVPKEELMPISLTLTPTQKSPYLMITCLTLNRTKSPPFGLTWLCSLSMRNNTLHKKLVARIFPMLD